MMKIDVVIPFPLKNVRARTRSARYLYSSENADTYSCEKVVKWKN